MQASLDAMKIALRVLQAISEKHMPDPAVVDSLRNLAPFRTDQPIDELACDVIKQALMTRANLRSESVGTD
jgi:hypothetical protein